VKNKSERSSPVRPPGVEKTSRLHSRDPVASWVKCGPHGGMDNKMKSWTAIGRGYTEFVGFQSFTGKPLGSLVDPQSQDRRNADSAAAVPDRWVPV
jgi:hypothetical protein